VVNGLFDDFCTFFWIDDDDAGNFAISEIPEIVYLIPSPFFK
jgi:hypothetical protein